jgi:hypothetical protein
MIDPARRGNRLAAAALGLLLAACGATGGSNPASGDPGASGGAARELDEKKLKELEARWRLYLQNDPKWPEARERWLSEGDVERKHLLANLLIELFRSDAPGRGVATSARSARARKELSWFGAEAVPLLVDGMKALARRESVDVMALDRIAGTLVDLRALDAIGSLLQETDGPDADVKLRCALLRALAPLEDPAVPALLAGRLRDDPAWEVRGTAAEALRRHRGSKEARAALALALGDPDGFVRARAMRVLAVGMDPEEDAAVLERVVEFLLRDPAPEARAAAAEALALFAYLEPVADALMQALRDPASDVVGKSARALMNTRTTRIQLALADALDRAVQRRDESLITDLLLALEANVGAKPQDINPKGWRALILKSAEER